MENTKDTERKIDQAADTLANILVQCVFYKKNGSDYKEIEDQNGKSKK